MRTRLGFFVLLFFLCMETRAESFRALLAGHLEVSLDNPAGVSIPIEYNGSVLVSLGEETRFFRGIELELSAPQLWLSYRGSLAMALYADLDHAPRTAGVADLQGRRIAFEPLPNKMQIVYQIPIRPSHGLRASPYAAVPAGVTLPPSFPLVFRIMPIIKGLSEELESMTFQLSAKPIFSDEGAVRLNPRYPEQLQGKPFMVLIDDVLIDDPTGEQLLKEGEHHLVILSDDYRNENRLFLVERARVLDLAIELQDPTPLIILEKPENARVFLDNRAIHNDSEAIPVEPGIHEIKFQVSDYTIIKSLTVQRGKTYRVALTVDVTVSESD